MKCEVIQDLLDRYIDQTCSEETKKLVEEHLQTCQECRTLYQELSDVEYENQPVINEKKPFIKVKRDFIKKIVWIALVFLVLFLFFGSRITSTIVKARMNAYVNKNYSHLDLEMTSFAYRDPEAQGFGVNNAYYVAEFSDPNQQDLSFAVYTEGFFLNLTDNYEHQIEDRYRTVWRLTEEYSADVHQLLKQELSGIYVDCSTGLTNDHLYDFSVLDLNQSYDRSVDTIIPMSLHLNLSSKEEVDSKVLVKDIVEILKENEFNTPYLSISLIVNDQRVDIPEIYNLEY